MKCLNCNNETVGRSSYCSSKCKVAWNRNRKRNTEAVIRNANRNKSVTSVTETETVTPEGIKSELPANYGREDCACKHCQVNRRAGGKLTINHGAYKPAGKLAEKEVNRVSLPGDVDYVGVSR